MPVVARQQLQGLRAMRQIQRRLGLALAEIQVVVVGGDRKVCLILHPERGAVDQQAMVAGIFDLHFGRFTLMPTSPNRAVTGPVTDVPVSGNTIQTCAASGVGVCCAKAGIAHSAISKARRFTVSCQNLHFANSPPRPVV